MKNLKYRCPGCDYGIYARVSGPSICAECKTKYRFARTEEEGWHLVEIPEPPEGENCEICGRSPCRCEEILRWSENVPYISAYDIDVQYPR